MKRAALLALIDALPLAQPRVDRAALPVVQRFDRYAMRIDAASVVRHPNGMIDAWGVATRVGVFLYDDEGAPGQVVREYRPPDEVLDEASLETLRGVPFTIDHPAGDVTSANASDLTNGWVLDVRVDGDLVRTLIRIATDEAKQAIDDGTIELSCGYTARLEELGAPRMTPGGERYDAIQRDIRYNHLALVDLARAGHVARLHLDQADRPTRVQRRDQRDRPPMRKFKLTYTDAKGKKHAGELAAFALAGLVGESERIDKLDAKRRDAIETGTLSVDTGDGPVELVLPIATIDQVLQMIGAGSAEAAPEPEPEPEPEAMGADDDVPPATGRAFGDAKGGIDAKRLADFVKRTVADAIADTVPKALARADAKARGRAELERKVAPVLDQGYAFADADDFAVMADAIEAIEPGNRGTQAKLLATRARRGDARAAGRLEAELDHALASRADEGDRQVADTMGAVFSMQRDAAERPEGDDLSPWERARADRIAKRAGRKPDKADDKAAS